MADRLSALDTTFLELEDADPSAHMHIGGILVFGPAPGHPGAPPLDDLRRNLDARLGALPRYRMRLATAAPAELRRPEWREDPGFDIARHVRRAALPAPGGWEELLEWAEAFYSQRLDRTEPLWEMVVLDGLAGGHWALCTKTHHCLVDGVGSVDVVHLLLDAEPDAPPWEASPAPGGHRFGLPSWIGAGVHAALHPRESVAGLARSSAALAELLVREELRAAPHTSLNGPIGGRRRLRAARVPLAEAKRIKALLGGTVNDVVLAGVAGGLREILLSRGEPLPQAGIRAMVPLNVRTDDGHGKLGNRISSLFVDLPVAEPEPIARYERIREATAAVKASREPAGAGALLQVGELAPPVVHSLLSRSLFATRLFNVTVTNVPGPQQRLYALGAPLRTVYPLVPLAAEHALGVAIVSYDGQLNFGVNADYDTVPDVDVFAEGIAASLAELQQICHTEGTVAAGA